MEDVLIDLENKNVTPLFVGLQDQPRFLLEQFRIIPNLVPENNVFADFNECAKWIESNVEDAH